MATRAHTLLRLASTDGWSVELDSTTAVGHWNEATKLGVLAGPVEWRMASDPPAKIASLQVLDPGQLRATPATPRALADGWAWNSAPLLFDNGRTHVEIALPDGASEPEVFHLSRAVCERFVAKSSGGRWRLVGLIEPGNDVGRFELAWQWRQGGVRRRASLGTTVLSTKMNLQQDFPRMVGAIREAFPARLQLDILRQTQWGLESADGAATLQSWLSVFRALESELIASFDRLIRRPRLKLEDEADWRRLERIRHVPAHLEEQLARAALEHPHRLHRVDRSVLDPDRLENRFAKHVANSIRGELARVHAALKDHRSASEVFVEWLGTCTERWEGICSHPFWRPIGTFQGFRQESLTLQRDPVYATIRNGWGLLRRGLNVVLSGAIDGGIRSIEDLYELWCLVQMDRALVELGWERTRVDWAFAPTDWNDLGRKGSKSRGGSARLAYADTKHHPGESLALVYQAFISDAPQTRGPMQGFFASPVDQEPDLVLRQVTAHGTTTWLFDAKYRVDVDGNGVRSAPTDAIHQMQRYRDALLTDEQAPVREAWGGYVLFPGAVTPGWKQHAQASAIDKVNIGAFPLRCAAPVDGYHELLEFIARKLAAGRTDPGVDPATPGARGFSKA